MEKRLKDEYWISEYVITKNDNSVRGIYISKEKFNPDEPENFLIVFSYRDINKKIGFPKRSQRIHILRKLLSTKDIVSAGIGISEMVKANYKKYDVFRCNVEKADFEILNNLGVKLKDYGAKNRFDKFFKKI